MQYMSEYDGVAIEGGWYQNGCALADAGVTCGSEWNRRIRRHGSGAHQLSRSEKHSRRVSSSRCGCV